MRIALFTLLAFLASVALSASPVGISAPFVDPTDFRSGSGQVICQIDPSDKFGAGGAQYRVTKDGIELWAGSHDFTLYEAAVGEDGSVYGFGYTHGWLGKYSKDSAQRTLGNLVVAAIDHSGHVISKKEFPRSIRSPDLDTSPSIPWPEGARVQIRSATEEFSIWIRGESGKWAVRRFKLSTGEELEGSNETPDWNNWRDPHEIKSDRSRREASPLLNVPPVELTLLKRTQLKQDGRAPSMVQNTIAMAFDGGGNLGLVRALDRKSFTLTFVHRDGRLIKEIPIELTNDETSPINLTWLRGDKWALTASTVLYFSSRGLMWVVDVKEGTLTRMNDLKDARPLTIRANGMEGLMTITMGAGRGSMGWILSYYPGLTNAVVRLDKSPDATYGSWTNVDRIADCLGLTNSVVVSLHTKPASLVQWGIDGKLIKTISFGTNWPSEFEPSRICAPSNGTFKVAGSNKRSAPGFERYESIILDLNADGEISVTRFAPHFPDGRPIVGQLVEFSPTGDLWMCDGNVLARINDMGEVAEIPGSSAGADRLNRISAATIDSGGRIYAVDSETSAVHVFNSNGDRVRIIKPKTVDENRNAQSISVADDGTIFITGHRLDPCTVAIDAKTLDFASLTFGLERREKSIHALKGDKLLALSYEGGGIFDRMAKQIRSVDRQPDRKWLGIPHCAAVAADGTIAISSSPNWDVSRVSLYSGDGDPIRTFPSIYSTSIALTASNVIVGDFEEILFMDRSGKPLFKTTQGSKRDGEVFAMNNATELWVLHKDAMEVEQFVMPKAPTQ